MLAHQNYSNVGLFTIESYGGHAFVKIGQNYFDAQNPLGVPHWTWFEILKEMCPNWKFSIYNITPWRQSLNEFFEYWRFNGKTSIIDIGNNVHNRRNRKHR